MAYRILWNHICALVLLLALQGPKQLFAAEAESPFKIGVILPLSGANASLGGYIKNGIDLAYEQLPEGLRRRVVLKYEDDGLVVTRSVSALKKLITIDKINVALAVGSGAGNALAPIADQHHIPFIAIGASDKKVVAGRKFAFLHWVTPEAEAKALVDEALRQNYQRLAIIAAEQEGLLAIIAAVKSEFATRNKQQLVVLEETFLPDESDYRSFLAKAKSRSVDAVIAGLFPGVLPAFAKQARSQLSGVPLIGIESFEDEAAVKAADGALLGQWYVNAASGSEGYAQSYEKRFGSKPGWASANGHDSLALLVEAFSKHGADSAQIANYLATVKDFNGAMGRYSASGDHRFNLPAAVKVVTATGFEAVER